MIFKRAVSSWDKVKVGDYLLLVTEEGEADYIAKVEDKNAVKFIVISENPVNEEVILERALTNANDVFNQAWFYVANKEGHDYFHRLYKITKEQFKELILRASLLEL